MNNNKCKQCQYEWKSRKEIPKSCPRCKRYDWDKNQSPGETLPPDTPPSVSSSPELNN